MNNRDKIYKYFDFTNISTIYGDKYKRTIAITSKVNLKNFLAWALVSGFLIIVAFVFIGSPLSLILKLNETFSNNEFNSKASEIFDKLGKGFFYNSDVILGLIVLIAILVTVFIKSKLLFKKLEPKHTNINLYERELPSKLRPAHMRVLVRDGLVDDESFTSTIIDLIERGYLSISTLDNKELDITDFILTKTDKDDKDLLKYEIFIIDWFINKYGDGTKVSSSEFNNGLIDNMNVKGSKPCELFDEWQTLVFLSFPFNKYYKRLNKTMNKIKYTVMAYISFAITMILPNIGMSLLCYSVGCIMFASPSYILTKKGIEEIEEWLDLKRFLIDFTNIKDKTTEMTKIWDFYVAYAIALNINTVAEKEITSFFEDKLYKGTLDQETTDNQVVLGRQYYNYKNSKEEMEEIKKIESEISEELKKANY